MTQSIRLFVLGLVCAAIAGCTSTNSDMSSPALSLAPDTAPPLVSSAGMVDAPFGAPNDGAPVAGVVGVSATGAPMTAEIPQDLYYLEFRARSADSYGHSFVMFGRRDAQGRILTREVAGLHPATTSVVPYMAGHVVPVPAETGPSDGDLEDQYMTANYRFDLTRAEYEYVLAYIRRIQASRPLWHAVIYNCNSFIGDIAQHMGLRAPHNLLFPENYINQMKELNAGRRATFPAA